MTWPRGADRTENDFAPRLVVVRARDVVLPTVLLMAGGIEIGAGDAGAQLPRGLDLDEGPSAAVVCTAAVLDGARLHRLVHDPAADRGGRATHAATAWLIRRPGQERVLGGQPNAGLINVHRPVRIFRILREPFRKAPGEQRRDRPSMSRRCWQSAAFSLMLRPGPRSRPGLSGNRGHRTASRRCPSGTARGGCGGGPSETAFRPGCRSVGDVRA